VATEFTQTDTLVHIGYDNEQQKIDDPAALHNQVSSTGGRIVIVSAFGCSLVVEYSFTATGLNIQLILETPVGSVTIASTTLNPSNPSITVGGSIGPFKAEATVSFDFATMTLTASGEVCAPFAGCKKGSITIHV
jgi:hypothetical protein